MGVAFLKFSQYDLYVYEFVGLLIFLVIYIICKENGWIPKCFRNELSREDIYFQNKLEYFVSELNAAAEENALEFPDDNIKLDKPEIISPRELRINFLVKDHEKVDTEYFKAESSKLLSNFIASDLDLIDLCREGGMVEFSFHTLDGAVVFEFRSRSKTLLKQ